MKTFGCVGRPDWIVNPRSYGDTREFSFLQKSQTCDLLPKRCGHAPPWFEVVESCGALMPPSWVRRCASTSASAAAAPSGFKFAFSPQSPCLKVLGLGRYRFGLGKKGELGTRKSWSRACCWHWGSVAKELERTSQRAARLAPWASTLASSASKLAPWESTLANVSSRWNAPDFSKSTAVVEKKHSRDEKVSNVGKDSACHAQHGRVLQVWTFNGNVCRYQMMVSSLKRDKYTLYQCMNVVCIIIASEFYKLRIEHCI